VLGDPNYYIVITAMEIGLMFVLAPFVPRLARAFGKKAIYLGSGAVMIAGCAGVLVAPSGTPHIALGCFLLIGVGLGVVNTLMWSLEADTVDYGEWKIGVRAEGATYAVFSLVRKVGQALGGAAAAYTIGLAGGAVVQSSTAVWGIRAAAGLIPAVPVVIALAIMVAYPSYREGVPRHHGGCGAAQSGAVRRCWHWWASFLSTCSP